MRHINRALAASCFAMVLSGMINIFPASGAQPTTAPSGDNAGVLVLPFTPLNQSEYQPWLGRSIQQSLMADLAMAAPGQAISAEAPAADDKAAIDAGRKAGARFVVYGSFATSNGELRATGEVVDVSASKSIAGLKATGPTNDVFQLEDLLARQVRRRLNITLAGQQAQSGPVATEVPAPRALEVAQQPGNEYDQAYVAPQPGAAQNQTIYNSYYYGNPSSGFGYPGYGGWGSGWGDSFGGVGLSSGFGFPFDLGFGDFGLPFGFGGHFHHHRGNNNNSDLNWNGSFAAGVANTRDGTPLGGVGTFPSSGFGGQFGTVGNFHSNHGVAGRSTGGAHVSGAHAVSGRSAANGHR